MNDGHSHPLSSLDARIPVLSLLTEEELLLLRAASDLGCALSLLDAHGETVVGPDTPKEVLTAAPGQSPWFVTAASCDYLCSAVFHDGEQLCLIVCRLPSSGASRALGLRTAHYFIRLAETLLTGGLRRVLTTRVHLACVEEAYCELQNKSQRLEQAIVQMRDADRVKASFLSTVSHELRTPLTSVLGYSEMLMEGLAGPLNPEQREYLQTVMDKGEQLLGLISKLLDVSRIEAAGVQLQRTVLQLPVLLNDVLQSMSPQSSRKRLQLTTKLPPELLAVEVDRDKLRQVLVNLCSNAIKFTPQDGSVTVTAANLVQTDKSMWVLLSVADSGIGIPTHLHDKVFDTFYQVDNSATREYEGSGLGLSIVRKYVDAHGGKVWIENRPGGGAIFHLTLPAASPRTTAHLPPIP